LTLQAIFSKKNTKWKRQEGAFKASTMEASVQAIVVEQEKTLKNSSRMLPTGDGEIRAKGYI
jgi:hypothetical protein